jgi:hypothetical protein
MNVITTRRWSPYRGKAEVIEATRPDTDRKRQLDTGPLTGTLATAALTEPGPHPHPTVSPGTPGRPMLVDRRKEIAAECKPN